MTDALQVGPLVLPYSLLVLLVAVGAGSLVARWVARRFGILEHVPVNGVLVAGLVAARLVFILQFHEAYLTSWLGMLDIRDGGWNAWAGLAGAWVYGAWSMYRWPQVRKPLVAGLVMGTVVLLSAYGAQHVADQASVVRLPELALTRLESGAPGSLDGFRGKPTVINLWASWCPPCRREMPVLHQGQKAYPDVHFVFVNQGETIEQVQQYLGSLGLVLSNVLMDPGMKTGQFFGQRGLPVTLFFDRDGRLQSSRLGELSAATLAHHVSGIRIRRDVPTTP